MLHAMPGTYMGDTTRLISCVINCENPEMYTLINVTDTVVSRENIDQFSKLIRPVFRVLKYKSKFE